MKKIKEPKHLLVLRILGFCLLCVGIVLIVLGSGDSNPALFVPGMFLCFLSFPCLVFGFMAKIEKMQIDNARYMQELYKDDLADISNTDAEKKERYCSYCGTLLKDQSSCPGCGSKRIHDKRN